MLPLLLLTFALRLWQLDSVPPGWRDDELIETLVISQKVLDGEWAFYYPDASGHEALYHFLHAAILRLVGLNVFGIRWLSVIAGMLAVPVTFVLGKRLFGPWVGLLSAAGLAFSFWSLMYSRFGLRHILMPLMTITAFYFFWRALNRDWRLELRDFSISNRSIANRPIANYLLAAVFMGLGFYTYFASRGVPLILLAFCFYVALFDHERFRRHWRGWLLMFGLTTVLALPLIITLRQQPGSEARVAELALPLVEARAGNFEPLRRHVVVTLSMFHSDGDDEWLYNIPHRPVFGPLGAIFFWSGVAIALYYALQPLWHMAYGLLRRTPHALHFTPHVSPHSLASAFLLLWWAAGIAPGFMSVPPASLGHTITVQSAVYILAALPVWAFIRAGYRLKSMSASRKPILTRFVAAILGLVLLAGIAARDWPDYFSRWPERGMVRFLYRADIRQVAAYLNQQPDLTDFTISGLLAGPWDKLALQLDLDEAVKTAARPRWYNPERAIVLNPPVGFRGWPNVPSPYAAWYEPLPLDGDQGIGAYQLSRVVWQPSMAEPICFQNGLCLVSAAYDPDGQRLELGWWVERPLDLPFIPLISNPPPPGVYAGPRLLAFAQLQDATANFLVGDDGLWVDPTTLQPGDLFVQQHWLVTPPGSQPAAAVFGLYDPMTGERILTVDGQDHLRLDLSG